MTVWSHHTATNPQAFDDLVRRSRQLIGGLGVANAGVFRRRGALTLYFSPYATQSIVPILQLRVLACATPDEMHVEVVAGPSDQPDAYALAPEDQRMLDEFLDELDEQGMVLDDPFGRPRRAYG